MPALLTYFDVRGRAEVVRLILEEMSVPYRERRVQLEEWPALKPTLPFGQMPTYEDGELLIVHSHAIYRHLARKHGLCGQTEAEHVRCDVVEESFVDAQSQLATFYWNSDFAGRRDEYERTSLPALLKPLETLLSENVAGPEYWVGSALTLADFVAWHFLDYVRPFSRKTIDEFSGLSAFKRHFETRPRVAAYLASERRPKTLTVPMAPFGGTPETS